MIMARMIGTWVCEHAAVVAQLHEGRRDLDGVEREAVQVAQ